MAEQNSTTALREAWKARKTAKAELRTAREKLTGIRKTRRALKEEWRRARKQRYENKAELQRLDGQLQERRREEDATIRHIRIQNEQINPIRGLQGRRDDLAQAESRLANLNVHLDQLQNKIAGLEILRRQAQDRRTKLDARLQELAGKIAEKNKERRSTHNEIERKKQYLDEVLRPAVAKAVWDVRVEEVRTPLKNLKDRVKGQAYLLQVFGGAGLVYAYALMAGLVHEWWLYCSNGLRIADYTVLSDFVLVWPVLWGVLLTPVVVFLVRRLLSIPWVSELIARSLCLLVGRPVWRRSVIGLGVVGLSLIGPSAAGYWTYTGVLSILKNNENLVTVLTNPPLRNAEKLLLVGSNSNYMFFKNTTGNDSAGVKAIPLSQIVCVGTDGCEAEAIGPDYVAEPLLQQFISGRMRMTCKEGEEPLISDLIRFVNDQPNPRCPECPSVADPSAGSTDDTRYEAMKALYQEKIGPKVQDIVKEFMDKSATRWTVFGFASPDGEEVENDSLSRDRARVVIDEMCRPQGNGTSSEKRKKMCTDMQVRPFGEWHPINGISNSRSAVIAACVRTTNETSPRTPPRKPVEVGSNNGEERRPARQTGDIPAAVR